MNKQKIKPLGNRIVVQRQEVTTSKGGILLPESAQKKPKQGKVLAVGPGKADEKGHIQPMDVKVGDEILFSSYGGMEFKNAEEDVLILSEDDILAVFN
jgi:chaperonin GroES